ncbi:MAG: TlpA family protein disulfide reductase [Gemmataceae bacterium]|nr:TlpA family protein disulfide reductase [Gemmataceae bacterium]
MIRTVLGLLVGVFLGGPARGGDDPKPARSPAEQFAALMKAFEADKAAYAAALDAAKSDAEKQTASDRYYAKRDAWRAEALRLLRQHPAEPAGFEVIHTYLYIADLDTPDLVTLIRKHHQAHPDLDRAFYDLAMSTDREGWEYVAEVADGHPDRAMRGRAAYHLGYTAKQRLVRPDKHRWIGRQKEAGIRALAEKYLTLAAEKYADVPIKSGVQAGKVGAWATADLAGLKNLAALRVGGTAPELAGNDLDGKPFKLSEVARGKVTVVVWWASWCGPCLKMVPHEKELVERLKDKPFALVGVNSDAELADAVAAAKKHGITWRSVRGTEGTPVDSAWNVQKWPTVYVLDAQGVIRFIDVRGEKIDAAVDELLAEMEKK